MKIAEPIYLFVYGTLRTGVGNPVRKEIMYDVELIGQSVIRGKMYDIGRYPGAVPGADKEPASIIGEVLKMTHPKKVLRILDQYEGFDPEMPERSEYRRDLIAVQLPNGKEVMAWVYWYNLPVVGKRRIRNNDYLDYLKTKKSS
jgi:gamma-glutamylcyclotransferase (GGCT)/AIG2-like uncharacterized protein YtfP